MCVNMGTVDKVIRIILGIALIAYGLVASNYIVAVIGLVPLLTGVFGVCPLYIPLKLNTGCKHEEKKEEAE
ncbi:DUF2892 domain-containing protein [Sulfurimonas sp. HSL-3221]|uniref:YgaP family membrane protein n=1 Tax=Sulfurimonadaceae TaxID=2771471 RepID=UPI001E62D7B0|nr:DUF2892 domain-containing protein [Sulfurimonas sp. HSL-3221]UFS61430.1 DUF2892 domain-containing protein [Sulfurimonas sp. HSL-3221]